MDTSSSPPKKNLPLGLFCAAFLSITNGSMLGPIKYAPIEAQGISFVVSFGVGVLAVTPLFAVIYFVVVTKQPPNWNVQKLLLPGLGCGLGWNIGNVASIYATTYLGYTVGFPLSQCAILVGGFWGIFLFKEITGFKRVGLFVLGALILVTGAVLLGLFGRQT
eukprot:TRINITY_DN15183_c0_g1_i1.p1 TRINITY_DN15183_c0_g1~~TRINITY_DN15183_c0_g1_i1.p1  ORF type:complete len:184 (-),score=28.84 TRINITY_DN15183_c0_g1_i1:200-688(-)